MQIDMNRFDDINHMPLRAFNRMVFLNNIREDSGKEAAEKYIQQFSEHDRKLMYIIGMGIKAKGVEEVRKEVTRGLTIVE